MSEYSVTDLGAVTAYAQAVENGYTGTLEQWVSLQVNSANNYNELFNEIYTKNTSAALWEQGGLSPTTGATASSTVRIRTKDFLPDSIAKIVTNVGSYVIVMGYADDGTFRGILKNNYVLDGDNRTLEFTTNLSYAASCITGTVDLRKIKNYFRETWPDNEEFPGLKFKVLGALGELGTTAITPENSGNFMFYENNVGYAVDNDLIGIGSTEPDSERAVMWINNEDSATVQVPEIDDSNVSDVDTWSSQKIDSKIGDLKSALGNEVFQLDAYYLKPIQYAVTAADGTLNFNGAETAYMYNGVTGLLPLPNTLDNKITHNAWGYNDFTAIVFYDAAKAVLSYEVYRDTTEHETAIPEGAKYFRLQADPSVENFQLIAKFNLSSAEKIQYLMTLMRFSPDLSIYDFGIKDKFTFQHTEISNNTGEEVYNASSNYSATDYIALPENLGPALIGSFGYTGGGRARAAFYDADKVFISGLSSSSRRLIPVPIPENAAYVRFGTHSTIPPENCLAVAMTTPTYTDAEIIELIRNALV